MAITTVMTQREEPGPSQDVLAHTKKDEPNVKIVTRPWYLMVLIRAGRVYLQSFFALATLDQLTALVNIDDFWKLLAAALVPAGFSLGQNALEILMRWDTHATYSTFRA